MATNKDQNNSADRTWRDQFDNPGRDVFHTAREMIQSVRPPALDALMETKRQIDEMIRPIRKATLYATMLDLSRSPGFREYHAANDTLQKVIANMGHWRSIQDDLSYDNEDDLEATEFELLPQPELILAEQKLTLVKQVTHIEKVIASIYRDHRELHHIHHREFEEMIAELLRSRGFEVDLTKQTRDGGKDIIALKDIAGLPMKFLVECKKYAPERKIGVDIIRGFSHVINTQQANKGIIFTTSYFTADAQKERQAYMPFLLDLKDKNDILDWVRTYVE